MNWNQNNMLKLIHENQIITIMYIRDMKWHVWILLSFWGRKNSLFLVIFGWFCRFCVLYNKIMYFLCHIKQKMFENFSQKKISFVDFFWMFLLFLVFLNNTKLFLYVIKINKNKFKSCLKIIHGKMKPYFSVLCVFVFFSFSTQTQCCSRQIEPLFNLEYSIFDFLRM